MSIAVNDVSFHYGPRKALSQISFKLQSGSFNALLGPNGAGKSTLFALLTRLYQLQQGDITILNQSINQQPAEIMKRLGVVFQQSTLDLDLTVKQNLLYHASLHGISTRKSLPHIENELNRLSMLDRLNDKVRSLNGGHRRRVEIARALLHKPDILLLDEPTVGLDPHTRRSLNDYVRSLCESENLTVLWATHLMEEIKADDPVVLLHQGEVKMHCLAEQLLAASQAENLTDAFHLLTSTGLSDRSAV